MNLGVNGRFLHARAGGVQRFALEIVRAVAERTHVTLFLPRGELSTGIEHLGIGRAVRGTLPGQVWEQLELPRRAHRAGVDLVLLPANAAPLYGGPNVVVLHDVLPLMRPADFTRRYRAWSRVAHIEAARRAAAVVTVSKWSANEIESRVGVPRDRLHVIRQGAGPLDRPASVCEVTAARERLGLEGPYFIAVTGADPRKGSHFLEKLARSYAPMPAPQIVVVGGASARVHATARVPDGEGTALRRMGRVSDVDLRALYTGSIALLHPSAAEGFGRPAVEALACGTRVIVGPYGPAREVLGDTADLVPLDVAEWRDAIELVANEDPRCRSFRIARGTRHARRYRWDEAAEGLLAVCRACLEPRS
jgi:glycosyltransferase involved in cell wall biosynthesis